MKIMLTVLTLIKKNTFLPEIAHIRFSKEILGTRENTAGHRYGTETSVPLHYQFATDSLGLSFSIDRVCIGLDCLIFYE